MDVLSVLATSGLDRQCIVVSGTIGEEAAVNALKSGANDFIVKDRLARLLPAISRELREAAEHRQRRAAEAALDHARVEDNEQVRTLARTVLSRNGYTVIEAANADEALRVVARHANPPDLLLTDVVMPGTSGRLLAQRLSEEYPDLNVLHMSGYTDDAVVHHGVLAPGVAFVQKPFTPATLTRAVREVLETAS